MIDVQTSLAAIERAARTHNVAIRAICRTAGITPSNWARWRHGTSPTIKKWLAVQRAVRHLIPSFSEPETASLDSTADHAARSSGRPIPEIELSPQLDGLPAQCGEPDSRGASPSSVISSSDQKWRECAEGKS